MPYSACTSGNQTLHQAIAGAATPFPGGPTGAQHVSCLAVNTVRWVHPEPVSLSFIHAGGAEAGVELRHLPCNVLTHHEVAGDGVAGNVPGPEDGVKLSEGENAVGSDPGARARGLPFLRVRGRRDA